MRARGSVDVKGEKSVGTEHGLNDNAGRNQGAGNIEVGGKNGKESRLSQTRNRDIKRM
jgi:hypothetical protein